MREQNNWHNRDEMSYGELTKGSSEHNRKIRGQLIEKRERGNCRLRLKQSSTWKVKKT